ncbi:RCN1 Calcipressin-like protein [Candida maltosa Xu316]
MTRHPTNTLIVTNVSDELLNQPEPLIKYLTIQQHLMELTVLVKFKRFLIRCDSAEIASDIKGRLEGSDEFNTFNISYSLKDNGVGPQFLEIPKDLEMKRFLISPPGSPLSEWDDWDKVEEEPNDKHIHDYLWEKLGNNQENMEIPKITLDSIDD